MDVLQWQTLTAAAPVTPPSNTPPMSIGDAADKIGDSAKDAARSIPATAPPPRQPARNRRPLRAELFPATGLSEEAALDPSSAVFLSIVKTPTRISPRSSAGISRSISSSLWLGLPKLRMRRTVSVDGPLGLARSDANVLARTSYLPALAVRMRYLQQQLLVTSPDVPAAP